MSTLSQALSLARERMNTLHQLPIATDKCNKYGFYYRDLFKSDMELVKTLFKLYKDSKNTLQR
jgi:uncharacterized protein (DUF608 family)